MIWGGLFDAKAMKMQGFKGFLGFPGRPAGVRRASGGRPAGVWRASGGRLAGVWRASGGRLAGVRRAPGERLAGVRRQNSLKTNENLTFWCAPMRCVLFSCAKGRASSRGPNSLQNLRKTSHAEGAGLAGRASRRSARPQYSGHRKAVSLLLEPVRLGLSRP